MFVLRWPMRLTRLSISEKTRKLIPSWEANRDGLTFKQMRTVTWRIPLCPWAQWTHHILLIPMMKWETLTVGGGINADMTLLNINNISLYNKLQVSPSIFFKQEWFLIYEIEYWCFIYWGLTANLEDGSSPAVSNPCIQVDNPAMPGHTWHAWK